MLQFLPALPRTRLAMICTVRMTASSLLGIGAWFLQIYRVIHKKSRTLIFFGGYSECDPFYGSSQIAVPTGHYGRVAPRSGIAVNHGITVGAGVIDIGGPA